MTSTLIDRVGLLVTNDPENTDGDGSALGVVRDAAIVLDGERVFWAGHRTNAPDADERLDLDEQTVVPGFVDSHSHLVFGSDRADEFAARMAGTAYSAVGIASTVSATRAAADDELRANARRLLAEMAAAGTTTVEIKSGYGLTVVDEARSMTIARELSAEATFLGAHVLPAEYRDRRAAYEGQYRNAEHEERRAQPARCPAAVPHEERPLPEEGVAANIAEVLQHDASDEP